MIFKSKPYRKKPHYQFRFIFLIVLLSLGLIPSVSASSADGFSEHNYEIFNGYTAKILVQRNNDPILPPNEIAFLVEYSEGDHSGPQCCDVFQWIQADLSTVGRMQINNHFTNGDYYFLQQFEIDIISINTSSNRWDASFDAVSSSEGTENSIDEHSIIYGTRYSNPDRIVHNFWGKAYGMKLINSITHAEEGTINVLIDFTLSTYYNRNELKVGVTVDFEGSGLPLSENTLFTLRLRFANWIEDRSNHEYGGGPAVYPDYVGTYSAKYTLPDGTETSSLELNRNYIELKDGQQISNIADPVLSEPEGEENFIRGNYDFIDLIWGHTTEVSLDPTLATYGDFGDAAGLIDGFQVATILTITLLGIIIIIIKVRKRIF